MSLVVPPMAPLRAKADTAISSHAVRSATGDGLRSDRGGREGETWQVLTVVGVVRPGSALVRSIDRCGARVVAPVAGFASYLRSARLSSLRTMTAVGDARGLRTAGRRACSAVASGLDGSGELGGRARAVRSVRRAEPARQALLLAVRRSPGRSLPGLWLRRGPGARFCGDCGTALTGALSPPPEGQQIAAAETPTAQPVAERRMCSVLFCDLVGFTPLSEARDPEEVRELLSALLRDRPHGRSAATAGWSRSSSATR